MGITLVVGMDEVGRGCWAGPAVAGAVLIGDDVPGVKDSKLLTRDRRSELDVIIRDRAVAVGLGWASVEEIDTLGLTKALSLAFQRALAGIQSIYNEIIIDGNYNFLPGDTRVRTLIDADATVPSVSAASIVAKVARDNYMIGMAEQYPDYGFDRHVGYGTAQHSTALLELGPSSMHRKSFAPVRNVLRAMA